MLSNTYGRASNKWRCRAKTMSVMKPLFDLGVTTAKYLPFLCKAIINNCCQARLNTTANLVPRTSQMTRCGSEFKAWIDNSFYNNVKYIEFTVVTIYYENLRHKLVRVRYEFSIQFSCRCAIIPCRKCRRCYVSRKCQTTVVVCYIRDTWLVTHWFIYAVTELHDTGTLLNRGDCKTNKQHWLIKHIPADDQSINRLQAAIGKGG